MLRTHGLSRRFGSVKAVDGVDLELRRAEVYGFLGRNGAGKTTTLRMLMGVLRPDSGEVELLGRRARRVDVAQKRQLGYVSQEQTFYPWMTAQQLGRFVGDFYPSWDAQEYLRLLSLLDVPPARKAAQLSGGTRMKLGLALALAHRPALLLLDEPTAGLDPVARREFLDIVRHRVRETGQTVLFSSHLLSEVEQVAHRVGILHDGQLRFQGTLTALRESVRRVDLPADLPLPPGFTPVGMDATGAPGRVLHALPEAWREGLLPPEAQVEQLSLEDIFLAYARRVAA
ncbi:MAG TPA: ABC transporter ATP-binding protein [Aggregicoccus sp.]|nr:ABC transporter ATP-binding protein [Aggregicoccus sp.]